MYISSLPGLPVLENMFQINQTKSRLDLSEVRALVQRSLPRAFDCSRRVYTLSTYDAIPEAFAVNR